MRITKFLVNAAIFLLLIAMLGVWAWLPWYLVLALAVGVGLWLAFTRSGRLALAATGIGLAGLPQRAGASSVVVVGIAGVVGVLVAMLAMGAGFKATLAGTGLAFDMMDALVVQLAGLLLAHGLEDGDDVDVRTIGTRARQDTTAIDEHTGHVQTGHGHQAAGHVLIAAAECQHAVVVHPAGYHFDAIGDDFPGDE